MYNLEKVEKKIAEVLDHTFLKVSKKDIMKEVLMVRMLKPNLQKYFYHTSINFPVHEDLSNEKMEQIGLDYLQENGFNQHQYIMFRHYDADHPHLHILVNRIDYDGKVVSDSNDYARSEKVLRTLEKKYNLTRVISSREAKERAMTKNELEMMKRTNAPSAKMAMQVILRDILEQNSKLTTEAFISRLQEKRIDVLFNQASTGYVSGISYAYEGMVIKGAKLGNDYRWSSIKNRINYEQERDRTIIYKTNIRSKSRNSELRQNGEAFKGVGRISNQNASKQSSAALQHEGHGKQPSGTSNQNRTLSQTVRNAEPSSNSNNHQFQEKSENINLVSLLDSFRSGNHLKHDHESDVGINELKKEVMKMKRKKRRLGF